MTYTKMLLCCIITVHKSGLAGVLSFLVFYFENMQVVKKFILIASPGAFSSTFTAIDLPAAANNLWKIHVTHTIRLSLPCPTILLLFQPHWSPYGFLRPMHQTLESRSGVTNSKAIQGFKSWLCYLLTM